MRNGRPPRGRPIRWGQMPFPSNLNPADGLRPSVALWSRRSVAPGPERSFDGTSFFILAGMGPWTLSKPGSKSSYTFAPTPVRILRYARGIDKAYNQGRDEQIANRTPAKGMPTPALISTTKPCAPRAENPRPCPRQDRHARLRARPWTARARAAQRPQTHDAAGPPGSGYCGRKPSSHGQGRTGGGQVPPSSGIGSQALQGIGTGLLSRDSLQLGHGRARCQGHRRTGLGQAATGGEVRQEKQLRS